MAEEKGLGEPQSRLVMLRLSIQPGGRATKVLSRHRRRARRQAGPRKHLSIGTTAQGPVRLKPSRRFEPSKEEAVEK